MFACGDVGPDAKEPAAVPNVDTRVRNAALEARADRRALLTKVSESEAVDGDGKAWTILGPVPTGRHQPEEVAVVQSTEPKPKPEADDTPWELKLSEEELANKLRCVRFQEGMMYQERDVPLERARDLQRARREHRAPPATEGYVGDDLAPPEAPQVATGLDPKWILHNPEARTIVSPTTAYPYRAVARIHFANQDAGCTGWFIGPRTVMSAAHCFYGVGTYAAPVAVSPGYNSAAAIVNPYGTWTVAYAHAPYGWTNFINGQMDWNFDYAILELQYTPTPNHPGWFGANNYGWEISTSFLSGYPLDRRWQQWFSHSCAITGYTGARWKHNCDAVGGNSGSPLF